jgi:Helix-turn-helix domain
MSREHEVRLPDRFWRYCTKISVDAKALYSILLTFVDYNTGKTHVGNPRLERESGYGRDKVKGLLAELETAGFIERNRLYVGNLKSALHKNS